MLLNKTIKYFSFVILAVALLMGIYTRFYPFTSYTEFKYDQARDSYIVSEMREFNFPLDGPSASIGKFNLSPYYYYIVSPAALLGNDPRMHVIPNAVFSFLSIPLLFYLIYRYAGIKDYKLKFLLSAIASLVWSTFISDITLANIIWNPGPIPFFMMLYLILFAELEKSFSKNTRNIYLLFALGFVFTVLVSLHSITMAFIPFVTAMTCYWRLLRNNFSIERIKAYSTIVLISLILLIPYYFSPDSIVMWLIVDTPIVKLLSDEYFVFALISLIGLFLFVNIKFQKVLTSKSFRIWMLNLIQYALIILLTAFALINLDKFVYYFQRLIVDSYFYIPDFETKETIRVLMPLVVVFYTIRMKKFKLVPGIYFTLFALFIIITQFFSDIYRSYYSNIIWTSPLILTISAIQFRIKWLRHSLSILFIVVSAMSIINNWNVFNNYLYENKIGEKRALNTEDMREAIDIIPEGSTIAINDQPEYELAFEYVGEKIVGKNLRYSKECKENCYMIYPKYEYGSFFKMERRELPDKEYEVLHETSSYYIFRFDRY